MFSAPHQHEARHGLDLKLPGAGNDFARALAGDWRGHGFSLVVWPSRQADRPCFLEMHRTAESLCVATGGDAVAAEPSSLVFDQTVSDMVSGMRLAREAGMWFVHPDSDVERQAGETLTLISTGAGGEVTVASGALSRGAWSDRAIAPVNTAPFAMGDSVPEPGTRGAFAPYDLGDPSADVSRCLTSLGASGSRAFEGLAPQAVLDDPTCLLRAIVERQVVAHVMTASVAGDAPFLTKVWVERIHDGAAGFDQLQYLQATLAHFAPFPGAQSFAWPQVRVATLRRVSGRTQADLH